MHSRGFGKKTAEEYMSISLQSPHRPLHGQKNVAEYKSVSSQSRQQERHGQKKKSAAGKICKYFLPRWMNAGALGRKMWRNTGQFLPKAVSRSRMGRKTSRRRGREGAREPLRFGERNK